MTASRALSNRSRVAPETRAHVLKIAAELRYRPDPNIAKLMHHLRTRRTLVFQGSICALTNRPPEMQQDYLQAIVNGARHRAEALGYGFNIIHLDRTARPQERLGRILRNRGVEGILLLPMADAVDLGDLLDWREFSAVAATLSVTAPQVHRVTPHHYANTLLLCRRLAARGYRRIGLVIDDTQDRRVDHAFAAAVGWHQRTTGLGEVAPLIYTGKQPDELTKWQRAFRPDAIITTEENKARVIRRLLGPARRGIGIASTNTMTGAFCSGIDELPLEIGHAAAELLANLIQRGTKGLPMPRTTAMIEGTWCDGRSSPPRRPAR
jgi:DNA-binding LacI/PurR family transcriptional regulator